MKSSYRQFEVAVAGLRSLSPHFTRVTFTGPDLDQWAWYGADQRIKLVLPGSIWRTYTIRDARPELREVDVDFVSHGLAGPATRWLAGASVGDELALIGPASTSGAAADGYVWKPGGARTLLLAADETAVPAVAVILHGLAPDARGHVFLEVPSRDDVLALDAPAGMQITWLPRDAQPSPLQTFGGALVPAVTAWIDEWSRECERLDAVESTADEGRVAEDEAAGEDEMLWDVPEPAASADLYAWLAGEAGAITGLRRHLVRERGVDRTQVAFMGYWKLGRSEN